MTHRVFSKSLCALLLGALICLLLPNSQVAAQKQSPASFTDEQVIQNLLATDETVSKQAAQEVVRRGERMVPLLMKLKGNHQCFYADWSLGDHASCDLRLVPEENAPCYENDKVSTVEIAALFLIQAIYYNSLEFTRSATLYETKQDNEQWLTETREGNGHELIAIAWAATEKWFKDSAQVGIESLRTNKRDPFTGARVRFF